MRKKKKRERRGKKGCDACLWALAHGSYCASVASAMAQQKRGRQRSVLCLAAITLLGLVATWTDNGTSDASACAKATPTDRVYPPLPSKTRPNVNRHPGRPTHNSLVGAQRSRRRRDSVLPPTQTPRLAAFLRYPSFFFFFSIFFPTLFFFALSLSLTFIVSCLCLQGQYVPKIRSTSLSR